MRSAFLIAFIFLFGQIAKAVPPESLVQSNMQEVDHYMATSDTNGLYKVLININENFHLYYGKEFLPPFHRAALKAELDSMPYATCFYIFLGLWYKNNGDNELAIDNLTKSYLLERKMNGPAQGLWIMIEIGNIFYGEDDPDQAAIFYNKALVPALAANDHFALSVIYLNLGLVEKSKRNFLKEIDWLKKSAEQRLQSKDPAFVCHTYSKMADAYLEMEKTDSAARYLKIASDIYNAGGQNFGLLHEMPALLDLGYYKYYMLLGNEAEAQTHLKNARAYLAEKKLTQLYLETFVIESKYLEEKKDYRALVGLLDTAIDDFHREGQIDYERQARRYLGKAYAALGEKEKSVFEYEKLIELDDSLKSSSYQSKLNQIRSIIDLFEKDAQLDIAQKELTHEIERESLRERQRNIVFVFTLAAFILSIFLFVLLSRIRKQKEKVTLLNRELEQKHEEIRRNAVELEKSNLVKDKLFSIIGHDLRSPLNVLLGQAGVIKNELKKEIPAAGSSEIISSQVQQMESTLKETVDLFERLLQWSKLDKKEIHFNPVQVNLAEVSRQVQRFYEPMLLKKNIRLTIETGEAIGYADMNITQTILRNLVSNSLNAIREGDAITICTAQENGKLKITVSDTGPGFPEKLLAAFASGYSVDATQKNGLGLILCRELARMNNGVLVLENKRSGGASASFTIPVYAAEAPAVKEVQTEFSISAPWRKKLSGVKQFKVYQSTQVRGFLRELGRVEDTQVSGWMSQLEKAVFLGNREMYEKLIAQIDEN